MIRIRVWLWLAAVTGAAVVGGCASAPVPTYDLVIANGRVIDPESGLGAVRHVGVRAGTIAAVSESRLAGTRVIDATGHVVAPGFIDLHEHGQVPQAGEQERRENEEVSRAARQ